MLGDPVRLASGPLGRPGCTRAGATTKDYVKSKMKNMPEQDLLGSDGLPVRESGTWVEDKLYYLERYLKIFSVGMKNKWGGRLYYVDLFAGPGRCRIRGTHREIDGSPLVALLG